METCNAASYKYNGNEKLKLRNFNSTLDVFTVWQYLPIISTRKNVYKKIRLIVANIFVMFGARMQQTVGIPIYKRS
jgi:hypothetical protein